MGRLEGGKVGTRWSEGGKVVRWEDGKAGRLQGENVGKRMISRREDRNLIRLEGGKDRNIER